MRVWTHGVVHRLRNPRATAGSRRTRIGAGTAKYSRHYSHYSMSTTIQVSTETRNVLEYLKMGGQTYDDVIRELILLHPQKLTMAELVRRARGPAGPIEELIAKSRAQPY